MFYVFTCSLQTTKSLFLVNCFLPELLQVSERQLALTARASSTQVAEVSDQEHVPVHAPQVPITRQAFPKVDTEESKQVHLKSIKKAYRNNF